MKLSIRDKVQVFLSKYPNQSLNPFKFDDIPDFSLILRVRCAFSSMFWSVTTVLLYKRGTPLSIISTLTWPQLTHLVWMEVPTMHPTKGAEWGPGTTFWLEHRGQIRGNLAGWGGISWNTSCGRGMQFRHGEVKFRHKQAKSFMAEQDWHAQNLS